ncbi:MAG: flagellar motor protein MotD [Gammaproteobacteria bacterium]|nr:MAG: flagellar motor protein MotD [Gammaproteobacteria bacterium]
MARKPKHEEHVNHERWLVSYADFITLLFAFFVVMYSISSVNEGKFRVLSDSITASFQQVSRSTLPIQIGGISRGPAELLNRQSILFDIAPIPLTDDQSGSEAPILPNSGDDNGPLSSGKGGEADAIKQVSEELQKAMSGLSEQGLVSINQTRDALEIEMNTSILFTSGSATIADKAAPVLRKMASILGPLQASIRVEGYTDNVPIYSDLYPSNWELSAGRAASVVRLFADSNIHPARLSVIGYGEYRPVADNSTDAGRSKNRRIVLVVKTDSSIGELMKAADSTVREESGLQVEGIFKKEPVPVETLPPETLTQDVDEVEVLPATPQPAVSENAEQLEEEQVPISPIKIELPPIMIGPVDGAGQEAGQ